MAQLVNSNRGKRQLLFEGYLYNFHKSLANGQARWRCSKNKTDISRCLAVVLTEDPTVSDILGRVNEHTCPHEPWKAEVKGVNQSLKRRAVTTQENPRVMIGQVLREAQITQEAQTHVSQKNLKRNAWRYRAAALGGPVIPRTLDDLHDLPEQFTNLEVQRGVNECMLKWDNANERQTRNEGRILLFTLNQFLHVLDDAKVNKFV